MTRCYVIRQFGETVRETGRLELISGAAGKVSTDSIEHYFQSLFRKEKYPG
jgi:hypothetical protein